MDTTFQALYVEEREEDTYSRTIATRSFDDLPEGEVLIKVHYSSLNYKDALSASGNRGVTRRYPHTPGIDAAGVVEDSSVAAFTSGQQVVVTGYDLGMNTAGGFGQYIRVPAAWVVALPQGLSLQEAMIYGTAGVTAAQCVQELLDNGLQPEAGPVLVTGATGGVGSMAVAFLAALGFEVVAASGKESARPFLEKLGAAKIIGREETKDNGKRAILRPKWAGVVDTIGGEYLAAAIKSSKYGGIVTCCGNAASGELPLNVYPFILRAVRLIGIDSAQCSLNRRQQIWQQLAGPWRPDFLHELHEEIPLAGLSEVIDRMLAGKIQGRFVVNLL